MPSPRCREFGEQLLGQWVFSSPRNDLFMTSTMKRRAIAPDASPNLGSSFDKIKKRLGSFRSIDHDICDQCDHVFTAHAQ